LDAPKINRREDMRKAKLIDLRSKDVAISSGQEVFTEVNFRSTTVVPVYASNLNTVVDHAAVLDETVELPIVRIVKCHQESPIEEPECDERYFILSQELREALEVVRLEEKEKHEHRYLKVCSKLEDSYTAYAELEHKTDQVVRASLWKRIKYMITGNASKLLD
jgi:hypothetical protein